VIHVFGRWGKRCAASFSLGEFIGQHANICIITDEDPYDDNPQTIIDDVASAVMKTGKEEWKNVFKILDRKEAIAAQGFAGTETWFCHWKGSEQGMVVKGQILPWDDRKIVREMLKNIS
jgi:UDP-N-acetylmuramoyl-L-alanyl-D-glutamate--2,6-diaminopimelate ligase